MSDTGDEAILGFRQSGILTKVADYIINQTDNQGNIIIEYPISEAIKTGNLDIVDFLVRNFDEIHYLHHSSNNQLMMMITRWPRQRLLSQKAAL